jgi:hypothetical protein
MKLLLENWRRYLNEKSGEHYRVYHGALDATFPEFRITGPEEKIHDFGFFGDGLYFDSSLTQALGYAGGLGDWDTREQNIEIIEDAVAGKDASNIMESRAVRIINKKGKENAGVYVLDLQINNPYYWKGSPIPSIIQNPYLNKMPEDIANGVANELKYSSWNELVEAMEENADNSRWEKVLASAVSKTIRELGYDGTIMERTGSPGAEIIVFEPNQIRNALK